MAERGAGSCQSKLVLLRCCGVASAGEEGWVVVGASGAKEGDQVVVVGCACGGERVVKLLSF